jgi:hypothetical protein
MDPNETRISELGSGPAAHSESILFRLLFFVANLHHRHQQFHDGIGTAKNCQGSFCFATFICGTIYPHVVKLAWPLMMLSFSGISH